MATAAPVSKSMRRYHYVLAPETSDEDSDDTNKTESVYSMQDKETEYVRDESDTCTKSDASEYTLYSVPSERNPLVDTDSSEEFIIKTEKIVVETFIHSMSSHSGEHEMDSTLGSSDDSELGQADYWNCAQCGKSNNHPKYRYCMKCFKLRKEMFPPKPKATKKRSPPRSHSRADSHHARDAGRREGKKRKRPQSSVDNSDEEQDKTIGTSQSKSLKLDSTMKLDTFIGKFDNMHANSQIFSSLCDEVDEIQASKKLKQCNENSSSQSIDTPVQNQCLGAAGNVNSNSMTTKSLIGRFEHMNTSSQFFSNLCESVDKVYEKALQENLGEGCSDQEVDGSSVPPVTQSEVERLELSNTSALCIMCDKAPKNGAFVHMYEVHVCCCYPCALKVWKQTKKCPTCTLPASKVLKMIIS